MDGNNKFDYTYSAPTARERREIENIRKQYEAPTDRESKFERLRALNKRVTRPPLALGITMGVVGTLVLGVGMTMALEWSIMLWGVIVGVFGIAVAAAAYPVHKALLKRNKRKFGGRIIELSDELLNEKD